MRDYTKLKAFALADQLGLDVYKGTAGFPRNEQFGLTSQLRRAAVSGAANIVEGSSRNTEADYLHFLDMSFGSIREVDYELSLAYRLDFITEQIYRPLTILAVAAAKVLGAVIRSLRTPRY